MWFKPAHAALAACLLSVSAPIFGADESSISLREAIGRARDLRPELNGFVFELRVQDATEVEAALRPSPTVELRIDDALGSGSRSGFESAQTTLSLSQLIELGGKRDSRIEVANAQSQRLRSKQAARQLDVVAEIGRAFVEALTQQAREISAQDAAQLAQRVSAAVAERVQAAVAPPAERSRAAVAVTEAELTLEDARHVAATSRFFLASTIGLDRPDFTHVSGELFTLEELPDFGVLIARLEASPDFLRFTNEARLKQAQLNLAQSRRRGDLRASVGMRHFQQGDDAALVAGISLPLFSNSRAEPAIASASAELAQVDQQRRAALLKARAQLFAYYQEMEHARHVVATLDRQLIPELERALAQTEDAWRRGRYSFLEWSEVQKRLLDARLRRIDAAAEYHLNRIEIERLTGQSPVEAGEAP
ncbi:TolC family protein [Algiphilus sp. W345]|uniref:TolC family protein n=1 Tax=Banduia mediterranea TaxID=3075609 RepID=A0ABU2WPF1_9GAMM|nr:TolC family protein [Algiphilus sp. W345]MDT0499216.1 TolC family protein [Algiphilus sp. W345]